MLEPCKVLFYPTEKEYCDESIRQYQGCPTIAATRGGLLFAGWYSGGRCEPHIDNFNLVIVSEDDGATWSKPVIVIPSDRDKLIHSLDIQLWVDPDGRLWVFWVEYRTSNAVETDPAYIVDV